MARTQPKPNYLDPKVLGKVSRLGLKARLIVEGFISGLHESPFHGYSVEFAQHRKYVPGDDIRDIDWKVWARTDRLYIKEYEEETNLKAYMMVDVSESMSYASGTNISKQDYASYVAASLAYLMLQQHDSCGLVLFDEDVRQLLGDASHPGHLKRIVHELEICEPAGRTEIGAVFHSLAERLKRKGLLVVISDLFTEPEEILRGLQHLRHKRHEVILFHVLDDAEKDFPFDGLTRFEGMEGNPDVFAEPRSLREAYLEELNAFISRVRRGCRESHIDYVPLTTSTPLDVALSTYLAARLTRKGS
ncbi:MAG: DUF58 domain-containing protein [Planctomycetota bacterium]|nr:DUF58 domain-containing protein [Planctomycetota bacterium]